MTTTTQMTNAELQSWMDEMDYELSNPFDCLRCNDERFVSFLNDHSVCFECNLFHQGCPTCKSLRAASPFNPANVAEAWAKTAASPFNFEPRQPAHQPNGFGGTCLICGTVNYVVTANGKRPASEDAYICSGEADTDDCTDAYMADCAGERGVDWN